MYAVLVLEIVSEKAHVEDDPKCYTIYGVRGVNEKGEEVFRISDLSTRRSAVEQLIDACNRNQVSYEQEVKEIADNLLGADPCLEKDDSWRLPRQQY